MIYKKFKNIYFKMFAFFWDDPRIHKTSQMTLKFELYILFLATDELKRNLEIQLRLDLQSLYYYSGGFV